MTITVNGETLDQKFIDQELDTLTERYSKHMSPEEMSERHAQIASDAKENAIERLILVQEARKAFPNVAPAEIDQEFEKFLKQYGGKTTEADIPKDEIKKLKDGLAEGIRLEKYLKQACRDVPAPTEEECLAYYNAHKDEFKSPEMVHASHILRQPERNENMGLFHAAMQNIREQAVKSADFAQVARQFSSCNDNGGDLGWFPRGAMVESFENAVFALEPGQVSNVFQTEFGFHVAKVHEKRPTTQLEFEKVRKDIKKALHEERKNDEIGRIVDRLRESCQIVETPDKA